MDTPEQAARRTFGARADFYATSAAHTEPAVLERVVALAQPEPGWRALDIAAGPGHVSFALAPHVAHVVAVDLTPEMLAAARELRAQRGAANVSFALADAHALPFTEGAFDLVTSRRAPHHFSAIALALGEMRRVLRPGGRVVIDDRSVPEDDFVDRYVNRLDRYHDESHVREYRPSEWRRMLDAAGFRVEVVEPYTRHRPLTSLTDGASPENVRKLHDLIDGLAPEQRAALDLRPVDGELHIMHWFVMVSATRPS